MIIANNGLTTGGNGQISACRDYSDKCPLSGCDLATGNVSHSVVSGTASFSPHLLKSCCDMRRRAGLFRQVRLAAF